MARSRGEKELEIKISKDKECFRIFIWDMCWSEGGVDRIVTLPDTLEQDLEGAISNSN